MVKVANSDFKPQIQLTTDSYYSDIELKKISALSEAVKHLQNIKNIHSITEWNSRQISIVSRLQVIGSFWDIPEIDRLLDGLGVLQLSKNRQSRKEIERVLIGMSGKKKLGDRVKDVFRGADE